jgi:hypothetical protein
LASSPVKRPIPAPSSSTLFPLTEPRVDKTYEHSGGAADHVSWCHGYKRRVCKPAVLVDRCSDKVTNVAPLQTLQLRNKVQGLNEAVGEV